MAWDDTTTNSFTFWSPNPGTLYPAVFDLAERALAAAKSSRTFEQLPQHGWRCSLTGDSEWLTTDPAQLQKSYRQQKDTLWAKVHKAKKSWAKAGEHLGGLSAVKRLWPDLFAKQVSDATWSTVAAQLGEHGAVDLLGIVGYYSMLALVMNGARTPAPAGAAMPLPAL
jgi:CRISPR-associated protein Cmr2